VQELVRLHRFNELGAQRAPVRISHQGWVVLQEPDASFQSFLLGLIRVRCPQNGQGPEKLLRGTMYSTHRFFLFLASLERNVRVIERRWLVLS
jgi:hypothetical protein